MYHQLKTQLLCLAIMLPPLVGFALYPPWLSAGIDLKGITVNTAEPDRTLGVENDSTQRLIGTAVSNKNPADSFAVIEDVREGKQWIYREGDLIGAVLIKQIFSDRIIVIGQGIEEVIKLRRSLTGAVVPPQPETAIQATSANVAPTTNFAGSRNRHYLVNGDEVNAAFADRTRLLDTLDLHYVNRSSGRTGIKVGSFGPDSIFTSMGLHEGGLITVINDQPVTTNNALEIMQTMPDNGTAELKVRRRARTYRIHLQDLQIQ